MKKIFFVSLPLMVIAMLTGCSTYQYSSRHVDVKRAPIGSKETAAELVVNYNNKVTGSSDYQLTKQDAIREAEYQCIIKNNIDVIVDPIYRVEHSSAEARRKYRATVTGFAGKYIQAETGVDAVKSYDKEDIEKYKLLNDPSFPQHYYQQGGGDSYYFNSSTGEVKAPAKAGNKLLPLAFAPKKAKPQVRDFDFRKAKALRNTGIGLTAVGLAVTFPLGMSMLFLGETEGLGESSIIIGSAAVLAGVPCWIAGSTRMKRSNKNADIAMGGTRNGLGLSLRF